MSKQAPAMAASMEFHGMAAVQLRTPAGASAIISCHGAQVLSWVPAQGGERLYLSQRARYAEGTAIRGGIPVLFPQFGLRGPGVKHGLVRQRAWTLESMRQQDDYALASFRIESDAATLAQWPHAFAAELTVMLEGNRLDVELEIHNPGNTSFSFTAGLHTYLAMGQVEMARLTGLEGLTHLDARRDLRRVPKAPEVLFFDDAIDRVYLQTRQPLLLSEPARHLALEQSGFADVVVWNPWAAGEADFPDMAPGDYKRMLCVEPAAFEHPVELAAGADWVGRQTLVALPPGGLGG